MMAPPDGHGERDGDDEDGAPGDDGGLVEKQNEHLELADEERALGDGGYFTDAQEIMEGG